MKLNCIKYLADSLGNEQQLVIADYIDVGVFKKDENGEDKLIYLKKHKIEKEETVLSLIVDEKPTSAGIDPINKLIDRNPGDNVKPVEELTNETAQNSTD